MMCRILVAVLGSLLLMAGARGARVVTNDDLRSLILTVTHIAKESADRLSGHERREMRVADDLKKSLTGVDRRLNMVDEPLRMMNDRLLKLENVIDGSGQRSSSVVEREAASLADIQKTLQELTFHTSIRGGPGPGEAVAVVPVGQALGEEILAAVQRLDQRVAAVEREETARRQNETAYLQQILTATLTEKVVEIMANSGGSPQSTDVLDTILMRLGRLEEVEEQRTAALKATVQEAKEELIEIVSSLVSSSNAGLVADVAKSYESLTKELSALASVERVLVQTGDNVLDAKRRVEYGVHQILLEVGSLIKQQSKDLNETLNTRFDDISTDILSHQTENLGNLSTKIETEISQVWRQIGIMYEQLTASKSMLDRLQQQTEIYVNGSLQTMDGMEGKVGQITGRMGEVDENLNYLLGRLSLVTQEFNQIKSGLASALESIRKSFLELQGQVQDLGPGPNPIPDEPPSPAVLPPTRGRSASASQSGESQADNQV